MFARVLAAIVVVLVAAALAVLAWPQLIGLEQADGIAQVVALRGAAAGIALLAAVVLTLLALLARPVRGFFAALAVLALAFAGTNAAVLLARGAFGEAMPEADADTVTVLAWNTLGETPSAATIAGVIADAGADAVSLPETGYDRGKEIVDLLARDGIDMQQFTFAYDTIAKADSTTLLVSTALGEYTADTSTPTTSVRPSLVATPVDGDGPVIAAVHSARPDAEHRDDWGADLRWIAELCANPGVIVAGDVNSTIDHWAGLADPAVPGARIGDCADAAEQAGSGGIGTWPTSVPELLGTPIDHVLTGAGWTATGFRVIGSQDGSGSDHRPVVARLVPAA